MAKEFVRKQDSLNALRGEEEVQTATSWREEVKYEGAVALRGKRPWSFGGLQKRVARAAIDFEISVGILTEEWKENWFQSEWDRRNWPKYGPTRVIPYNLQNNSSSHVEWKEGESEKAYRARRLEASTEQFLRMAGWLRAASAFPTLVEFIRATQCGMFHSPHNVVNLWDFVERHPSPGGADRYLRKVAYQTNRFLRGFGIHFKGRWSCVPYNRLCPRKAGMATAANIVQQVLFGISGEDFHNCKSRDVLIAARGLTLFKPAPREVLRWAVERVNAGEFTCLRDALLASGRLVRDKTDGVEMYLDPTSDNAVRHGISASAGYRLTETSGREFVEVVWLVTGFGRSYHHTGGWYDTVTHKSLADREAAVGAALDAWQKQKKLERENKQFVSRLQPVGFCPIVYFQDSRDAGNCAEGTWEFMRRIGVSTSRRFVPASRLLPYLGEVRVANTLKLVAQKVATLGF
ncbi:MAG: hypothetical protein IPJ68_05865 [Candidatus Moraniibacteriota bacterium]|nr:MAG: hypothetical protein IPJ68_05865 [Candidatus Moranbacteria bacterium]